MWKISLGKRGSSGGSGSNLCGGGIGGGLGRELSIMDFNSCRLQNWNDGCYFFCYFIFLT